ncbi:hypothetical protein EDB89DRAFT_862161 [Lactarius sanguifluus]|nr:hypothetical protein EDB89DRAFT_862161 [Lactarius sanguifluus]
MSGKRPYLTFPAVFFFPLVSLQSTIPLPPIFLPALSLPSASSCYPCPPPAPSPSSSSYPLRATPSPSFLAPPCFSRCLTALPSHCIRNVPISLPSGSPRPDPAVYLKFPPSLLFSHLCLIPAASHNPRHPLAVVPTLPAPSSSALLRLPPCRRI